MEFLNDSNGPSNQDQFVIMPPDYVDSAELSGTAVQFTVPTGAKYVSFSSTGDFYALYGTNPTAAAPSGTTSDGTASECNPGVRKVEDVAKISVIGTSVSVTLAYYK